MQFNTIICMMSIFLQRMLELFSKMMCVTKPTASTNQNPHQDPSIEHSACWIMVANALDRLFLFIYFTVTVIVALVFLT